MLMMLIVHTILSIHLYIVYTLLKVPIGGFWGQSNLNLFQFIVVLTLVMKGIAF